MTSTQNPRSSPSASASRENRESSPVTGLSSPGALAAAPRQPLRKVWWLLLAAPATFLLTIVGASVIVGFTGVTDPNAIQRAVTGATPWLLVVAEVLIAVLLWVAVRSEGASWPELAWRLPPGRSLGKEVALGAGCGVILAAAYFTALSPLMVWAQDTFGDYVPPGELLSSLGSSLAPFFAANVVLAPFVEETLYRGFALNRLMQRFGLGAAIAIDCAFFGLLHWSGGLWYMVLTGVVAGGVLAGLFAWRRTIITSFAAHLTLNSLEFAVIAWTVTH